MYERSWNLVVPDPAGEELHELLVVHVQQLVEVDAAVSELAEGTLLLELRRSGLENNGDDINTFKAIRHLKLSRNLE